MYALQLATDGLFFTAALILLGQGIVVVHRGSGGYQLRCRRHRRSGCLCLL